jgi:hypothetical protein
MGEEPQSRKEVEAEGGGEEDGKSGQSAMIRNGKRMISAKIGNGLNWIKLGTRLLL